MQSISDALGRMHEDASWFARAHEVKLLVLRTSSDVRGAVDKLLPQLEFHHDNLAAWLLFEDARGPDGDGWQARANRLVTHWDQRREAFAKEGVEIQAVPMPPAGNKGPRILRDTTAKVLRTLVKPLEGLVFILSPTVVDDDAAFENELTELVGAPELARVRWIVVLDPDLSPPNRLISALGEHAIVSNCIVEDDAKTEDMKALLASSGGAGGKAFGMAAPKGVTPPPRVDDPPPLDEAERDKALVEAGIDPRYMEEAPKLRDCVLGAAVAMKDGKGPEAIEQQRQARDIAASLGLLDVQVICQITLASYLSGLDQRSAAIKELEAATEVAREGDLPQSEGQAQLALGLLHNLDGRQVEAARAYGQAGRASERAESFILAIECWRLAGQLALDAGQPSEATQSFQRAIQLAGAAEPDIQKASSAPEAARKLAELCSKRGLQAQAQSLYDVADRFEAGEGGAQEAS